MVKLKQLYTQYATIGDLLHNDMVMPNENFEHLLKDLGYYMQPLDLAEVVNILDDKHYGYITYNRIRAFVKNL